MTDIPQKQQLEEQQLDVKKLKRPEPCLRCLALDRELEEHRVRNARLVDDRLDKWTRLNKALDQMDKMDESLKCQENELSEIRKKYVDSCAETAYWKTLYTSLQEETEKEEKARSLLSPVQKNGLQSPV